MKIILLAVLFTLALSLPTTRTRQADTLDHPLEPPTNRRRIEAFPSLKEGKQESVIVINTNEDVVGMDAQEEEEVVLGVASEVQEVVKRVEPFVEESADMEVEEPLSEQHRYVRGQGNCFVMPLEYDLE